MTSPTFEVSGSVIAFADSGTATTFSVTPEAVTFNVVNVAGYTVAVTELDQLSDVNTSGVANGDVLLYDSGTWVAGTATGSGGTASIVLAGDVVGTAVAGTVTTDIADSGVAAGTYGASGTAVIVTVAADGRITAISGTAISGGGDSLPTQTGNTNAVLGTNGTAASWVRSFTSPDGKSRAIADDTYAAVEYTDGATSTTAVADSLGAMVSATNGTDEATARANIDGSFEIVASGAVTVTPGDGFHVVGDVGETVLSGDDYLMSTASDTDVQAPGATFARSRGDMGAKEAVESGDILAYPLYAQGHDGTSLVLAGQITAEVDGTVATGKVPTRIRIATADADGVLTDRLVLNPDNTSELNGTLLDLDTSGASTGDVATWDGTKIVLDTPTGGGGGGGGLVLVDSGTFSAASAGNLPGGVFDSTYDDYRLILLSVNASGSGGYENSFRMRVSGSDNTASVYSCSGVYHGGASGHKTTAGQTAWNNIYDGSGAGDYSRHVLDIINPALADWTTISGHRIYTYGGTHYGATVTGVHAASTAFDAMSFISSSGTITGRWALYGYAK